MKSPLPIGNPIGSGHFLVVNAWVDALSYYTTPRKCRRPIGQTKGRGGFLAVEVRGDALPY